VDVSYEGTPNPHNSDAIKPDGFPMRTGIDFLKENKKKDSID